MAQPISMTQIPPEGVVKLYSGIEIGNGRQKIFRTKAEQEEAGRLWAQNFSLGFKNGLADNLIPTTEGGALAIQEIAESGIDTIAEDFGKILPAIEGQLKKGSLNNTQFKAVKESLLNVGLNPEDYLNYNSRSIKNIEDLI